jgi:membrane protein YdbS with pleckstrin-like domain
MNDTNANLVFEADSSLLLEKNDAQTQGVPLFFAHWHIFAPTIVILIAYSFSWLLLAMADMSDTNLARLFIVVMAVFVPLLAAHAFLRYQTIRVQVNEDCLFCHPGWPKDLPLEVPVAMIEDVVVKRGLSGRLFGGGTLILHLVAENKVVIADLAEPDAAKEAILNAISKS